MDKRIEAEFDSLEFEKRLLNLKDTQDSIQAMSAWCLQNRSFHKKIVTSWLGILKQVKVEQRLTLFYLANDVIQYSKRKNYDFVDSWGTALQRATTMVRDEKVKPKIERIFKIWEQRSIYNEEFLADLNGLLSINPAKKPQMNDNDDEQALMTIENIKHCVRLEKETDKTFKLLPKTPLYDTESLNILKDRRHVEEVEQDVNEARTKLENYVKALSSEIKARSILISVLDQSAAFYHNQRGEVKVVANAYRNFGNRIKTMKKKLEELTKTLPSPIPSPDINAPSPGPADNDFVLPGDNNFDQTVFSKQTNGYLGYMESGSLPFDINDFGSNSPKSNETQPIQVISSAGPKDDFNIDDFFKSIMPDVYNPADSQPPRPVPSPASNYQQQSCLVQQHYTPHAEYVPPVSNPYNPYGANNYNPNMPSSSNIYSPAPLNPYRPPLNNAYGPVPQPPPPFPSANTTGYTPLPPPPPLPPAFDAENLNDEYNPDNWEMDMSWNSGQDTSFNQDGPRSPPHYERKGNANLIEYVDPSIEGHMTGTGDVDHRQLMVPPLGIMPKNIKGRPIDVDHRNLISLTGSPKTDKDGRTITNTLLDKDGDIDKDFLAQSEPSDVFGLSNITSNETAESKLVPPPSPPASLLTPGLKDPFEINKSPMNPPLLPPPRFQSPPQQKSRTPTKSPGRTHNGRDNTETIDMEMSDEDFDTLPEFLEDPENNSFKSDGTASNDLSDDRNNSNISNSESQHDSSPLRPPQNLFETPPPNAYLDTDARWDGTPNNTFETPTRTNPFSNRGSMSEPPKRPHEMMQFQQLQQQQQQQMLMQQQRMDCNTTWRSGGHNVVTARQPRSVDPGPNPRPPLFPNEYVPPPFMQQQSMNFRGPRANSPARPPYFRKGGVGAPPGNMRGGFRNGFRRNW